MGQAVLGLRRWIDDDGSVSLQKISGGGNSCFPVVSILSPSQPEIFGGYFWLNFIKIKKIGI